MTNFQDQLALLPFPVLKAVCLKHSIQVTTKTKAVIAINHLLQQGLLSLGDVLATPPWVDDGVPEDIASKVQDSLNSVERVRVTTEHVLDEVNILQNLVEKNLLANTERLNSQLKAIQGIDYNKVDIEIQSAVGKVFAEFRKTATPITLEVIANKVSTFSRKQVKDVFVGVICEYEHQGAVIDFSNDYVNVWDDVQAPQRVDDYAFDAQNLHQTLCALDDSLPDNVWLSGERGTGKTEFVTQVTSRLGRKLFKVSFDEAIERADFIGADKIKTDASGVAQCVFVEGIITKAIQHSGAIILLDELGFARAQSLASLHSVLEKSPHRAITISDTGLRFPVAPHVVFFCADNSNGHGDESGNFSGVRQQNSAFIDRFSYTLQFNYLSADDESALLSSRTGIPPTASDLLVKFANVAREKARSGLLTQPPSLRQLLAWARAIKKGVPVNLAFNNAIVNKFPSDCEAELRGIFSAVVDTNKLQSYLTK